MADELISRLARLEPFIAVGPAFRDLDTREQMDFAPACVAVPVADFREILARLRAGAAFVEAETERREYGYTIGRRKAVDEAEAALIAAYGATPSPTPGGLR